MTHSLPFYHQLLSLHFPKINSFSFHAKFNNFELHQHLVVQYILPSQSSVDIVYFRQKGAALLNALSMIVTSQDSFQIKFTIIIHQPIYRLSANETPYRWLSARLQYITGGYWSLTQRCGYNTCSQHLNIIVVNAGSLVENQQWKWDWTQYFMALSW